MGRPNIPPVKNKFYEWTKEATLKCYIVPRTACRLFSVGELYSTFIQKFNLHARRWTFSIA